MLTKVMKDAYTTRSMKDFLTQPFRMRISGKPKSSELLYVNVARWCLRIAKLRQRKLVLFATDGAPGTGQCVFELDKPFEFEAGRFYDLGPIAFTFTDAGICKDVQIRQPDILQRLVEFSKRAQANAKRLHIYPHGEYDIVEFQPYRFSDLVKACKFAKQTASYEFIQQLKRQFEYTLRTDFDDLRIEISQEQGFVEVSKKTLTQEFRDATVRFEYRLYTSGETEIGTIRIVPRYRNEEFEILALDAHVISSLARLATHGVCVIDEYIVTVGEGDSLETKVPLFDNDKLMSYAEQVCQEQFKNAILLSDTYAYWLDNTSAWNLAKDIHMRAMPLSELSRG